MKILLFGKYGQVGWELNRSLMPLGKVIAFAREDADFSDPESLRELVRMNKPEIIVNAAAYTAVDKAEAEEDKAFIINAEAPKVLAQEAKEMGSLLLHYSTDYVFDGTKGGPYIETDKPNPVNAYGRTKLAGEQAIRSTECDYLILRTSWVYSERGANFPLTILRLAGERQELSIVDDQEGVPTWARNIADITSHIVHTSSVHRHLNSFSSGIYNVASIGAISWCEFAREIVRLGQKYGLVGNFTEEQIKPILTRDYQLPARRPMNSVLSTEKMETDFGLSPVNWSQALECCIAGIRTG